MTIRRTGSDPARAAQPQAHHDNSSAAKAARLNAAPPIRGNRTQLLAQAPECVKKMADGHLPETAANFNTCAGWLARHEQPEGLLALFKTPQCSRFDTIDLRGQPLSQAAFHCLAFHLDKSSITALNLSRCGLGQAHAKDIGALLAPGSKLKWLQLDHNDLGNEGVSQLCEALKINKTLQHLSLKNCGLNSDHFVGLLRVLSHPPTSTTDQHMELMTGVTHVPAPSPNATLESLCLAHNPLCIGSGKDEWEKFWGLGNMPGIKWLDLSNTPLLCSGGIMYRLAQNSNPALRRVDFASSEYRSPGLNRLTMFKFVSHVNLQGAHRSEEEPDIQRDMYPLDLVEMKNLKVLNLQGVQDVFPLHKGLTVRKGAPLVCLRLDPGLAKDERILQIENLTPVSFGDLLGPAGAFLASCSLPTDIKEEFAANLEVLDMRSLASLLTVNRALADARDAGFTAILRAHSGDPGFDWEEVFSFPQDADVASSDSNSSNASGLITSDNPGAITTTTSTTQG